MNIKYVWTRSQLTKQLDKICNHSAHHYHSFLSEIFSSKSQTLKAWLPDKVSGSQFGLSAGKQKDLGLIHFGSSLSSKVVVYVYSLLTLTLTINEILKYLCLSVVLGTVSLQHVCVVL